MVRIIAALLLLVFSSGCIEKRDKLFLGENYGGIEIGSEDAYYTEIAELIATRDGLVEVHDIGYGRPGAELGAYENDYQGYVLGSFIGEGAEVRFGEAQELPPYPDVEGYVPSWTFFIYESGTDEWTYYDSDSAQPIRYAVANAYYRKLVGKTFIAEVYFDPTILTEYSVKSDGVMYRIELSEPLEAKKGELLEITILSQDQPLEHGERLPASAKKLTE